MESTRRQTSGVVLEFRVLGFWGFRVLGFWGFGGLGVWGLGLLGFRVSAVRLRVWGSGFRSRVRV